MTSRRSQGPREPRRSPRFHDKSGSQRETPTSTHSTSTMMSDKPQRKRTPSSKTDTPAQNTRSRANIHSTLKISRNYSMLAKTPGKSVRATPFRTPRLDNVPWHRYSARTSVKKKDAEKWDKDLQGLLKTSLKLCNLTSMANFKYKDQKLRKKYESTLKNKILQVHPSPVVTVKFTVTSCLSWQSSVVDAVWIEVKTLVPGDTVEQDTMMVVYTAWLIHTKHTQSSDLKSVQWLPVMLYRGRELIHQVVVDWLQGSFECYVARCGMRQSDFLWMVGICSRLRCRNSSHNLDDCKMEFNYLITPPYGTSSFTAPNDRGRPRIVIKLPLKDVHQVWDRLTDNSSDKVSLKDLQTVLSQFTHVTSRCELPSSLLRLQQMRTPCVSLSNTGKVQFMCRHSIAVVIQCFMEVFLQMTSSYKPDEQMQDSEKEDTIAELNNNVE